MQVSLLLNLHDEIQLAEMPLCDLLQGPDLETRSHR